MKIKKVEIQAFKAYKNVENGTFDFTSSLTNEAANFIALYAPNGFGKTSFFDAVDCAITGRITRYSRDNRIAKINKVEGKTHNAKGEKQLIIKNKNVNDSLETFVNVYTENNKYTYLYPKVRSGGADYNFPEKCRSGSEFFEQILLSQESIDAFLRETDPEHRYKKFLEVNSDFYELNQSRTTLITYKVDVENKIKLLNKDLKDKTEEIINNKKMHEIFNQLNEKIFLFNSYSSLKIEKIEVPFDIKKFYIFSNEIMVFKEKLRFELFKVKNNLEESKIFLKEIDILVSKINELVFLKDRVETIDQLLKFHNKKDLLEREIDNLNELLNNQKNNLITYKNSLSRVDDFTDFLLEFEKSDSNLKDLSQKVKDKKLLLSNLENNLSESLVELSDCDAKISINISKGEKQDELYDQIRNKNKELKALKFKIKEISISKNNSDNLRKELLEKENLSRKISIKGFDFDLLNNYFDDKLIDDLKCLSKEFFETEYELISIDEKIGFYKNELIQINSHYENLNLLINQARLIVDKTKQNNCPVCNHDYKNFEALQDKLTDNPFLNEKQKMISNCLTEFEGEKNKKKKRIKEMTSSFNKIVEDIFCDLNSKLDIVNRELVDFNMDVGFFEGQVDNLINTLQNLNFKVDFKEQEIFKNDLIFITNEMKNKKESLILVIKNLEGEILSSKKELYSLDNSLIEANNKFNFVRLRSENYSNFFEYKGEIKKSSGNIKVDLSIYLSKFVSEFEKNIKDNESLISQKNINLIELRNKIDSFLLIYDTKNLANEKKEILEKILIINSYLSDFLNFLNKNELIIGENINIQKYEELLIFFISKTNKELDYIENVSNEIETIGLLAERIINVVDGERLFYEQYDLDVNIKKLINIKSDLIDDILRIEKIINDRVDLYFNTELINEIYQIIDPHPEYKKISFKCELNENKPKLLVYAQDPISDNRISPVLGFSAAQINVLAMSIFLAQALNTKDSYSNSVDFILIDDPVQSIDAINTLSLIDFFRSISIRFNKQIIISTHDENFFELLKRKMPSDSFPSKFLKLISFGQVISDS